MEEDLKNPVRLATGRWIKSKTVALAWLHGASSPLKIRERLGLMRSFGTRLLGKTLVADPLRLYLLKRRSRNWPASLMLPA